MNIFYMNLIRKIWEDEMKAPETNMSLNDELEFSNDNKVIFFIYVSRIKIKQFGTLHH